MPMPSSDRMTTIRSDQPSVGTVLRQRREELDWQIEDVAQWLRIRARLLTALEADDFASMPGEAYAVGFLRAYAQSMQLDADGMVGRFQRDYRRVAGAKTELVFPQTHGERGVPVGLLIGAGFVLVAVAYAGWYHFSSHEAPIEKRVPSLAVLMPNTPRSVMTSPQVASVMPGQAPIEEKSSVAAPIAGSSAVAPVQPQAPSNTHTDAASADTAMNVPEKSAPAVAGQAPQAAPSPQTGSATVEHTPLPDQETAAPTDSTGQDTASAPKDATLPEGQLAVRAIAPAWVQIADHTGHVIVSRVLAQGEMWQGNADDGPYRISVGNAGGVVLMAHDVVSAPLGRNGAVRRNVSVTQDAVLQGDFGHGAMPTDEPQPALSDKAVASAPVPAHIPRNVAPLQAPDHTARKIPNAEPRHVITTDELNARQLNGQSQSSDTTQTH